MDIAHALKVKQQLELKDNNLVVYCDEGRTQVILQRFEYAYDITVTSVRAPRRSNKGSTLSQAWSTFETVRNVIVDSWTLRVSLVEVFILPLLDDGGTDPNCFTEDEMYAKVKSDFCDCYGWIYGISVVGIANEGLLKSTMIESQFRRAKNREMEAAVNKLSAAFLDWRYAAYQQPATIC